MTRPSRARSRNRSSRILVALFAALLTLVGPSRPAAQDVPATGSVIELLTASTPQQLWARDARLSFTASSARRAGRVLDDPETSAEDRAVAWMAIGASGGTTFRSRLVTRALRGEPEERRVAVLALGEMRAAGFQGLERVLEAEDSAQLGEHLVLALARSGTEDAERLVLDQASMRQRPLFTAAQHYVRMVRGGFPPPRPAVTELLTLRWRAAVRFGFVDGRRWKEVLTAGLIDVDAFVRRWLSRAAEELASPIADDYLVVWAVEGRGHERLEGAAARLPARLAELWVEGTWVPDDPRARRALVDAVVRVRNHAAARSLLERVVAVEPLNHDAQYALLAAGGDVADVWLDGRTEGEPAEQAAVAGAMGESGDERWLDELATLSDPVRALEVRAAAWVARARLGDAGAEAEILGALAEPGTAAFDAVVGAVLSASHDEALVPCLEVLGEGEGLHPELRLALLAGTIERGRPVYPEPLRELLRDTSFEGRPRVVRTLRTLGQQRDRALFAEVFPVDDDMELNVELALALTSLREGTTKNLLRAVLWGDEFAPAVLAAGVLVKHFGSAALLDEIQHDGPEATPERLRRLGLAIGEWLGPEGAERLGEAGGVAPEIVEGATLGTISTIARGR